MHDQVIASMSDINATIRIYECPPKFPHRLTAFDEVGGAACLLHLSLRIQSPGNQSNDPSSGPWATWQ